ncbi:MAG: hypothetical protein WCV70_01595 [Patescibacteria group bacterium]|jgi:hypothetical protein
MSRKRKRDKGFPRRKKPPGYKKGWSEQGNHHLVAKSRGGKDTKENKKRFSGKFHWCFHQVFDTLTPEESQFFLFILLQGKKSKWTSGEINALQTLIKKNRIDDAKKLGELKIGLLVWGSPKIKSITPAAKSTLRKEETCHEYARAI